MRLIYIIYHKLKSDMLGKISVVGLENDITELIARWLGIGGYEIVTVHTGSAADMNSPVYRNDVISKISTSGSQGTVICNMGKEINPAGERVCEPLVMHHKSKLPHKPLLVLTGGGTDAVNTAQRYTPFVMKVPPKDGRAHNYYDAVAFMLSTYQRMSKMDPRLFRKLAYSSINRSLDN